MKIYKILFAAFISILSTPVLGQSNVDSLPCKVKNPVIESFFVNESFWLSCQNSAGLCFNRITDFSKVELFTGYEEGDYRKVYQPKSTQFYGFSSKGIKELGKLKFIGSFLYNRETSKEVGWSQMMDADRPSPLIIADSIGGDWKKDRYDLGLKMGTDSLFGWLHLGVGAKYAVGHGGRDNDPRPKSLTRDFTITPSAMVELSSKHVLGFSYSLRAYRQDIDIVNNSGVGSSTIFKILGLRLLENPVTKSSMEYRIDGLDQFADVQYDLRMSGWNSYAKVSYGLVTEKDISSPYKAMVDTATNDVYHIPVNEAKFSETQYEVAWGAEVFSSRIPYSVQLSYGYYDAEAYSYISSQVEYTRKKQFVNLSLSALLNACNQSKALTLHLGARYSQQEVDQAFYAQKDIDLLNVNARAEKAFLLFGLQSSASVGLELNKVASSDLVIKSESVFIPEESEITTPVVRNTYYYETSDWVSANASWNLYFNSKKSFKPYIGFSFSGLKVLNSDEFSDDYRWLSTFKFGIQL
ncbi:MAG: DUF6850 family outer membrane beta-barrel protein [Bacteroidales bacterium]